MRDRLGRIVRRNSPAKSFRTAKAQLLTCDINSTIL
jgi:hypothetical protein